jgi:hypothetical protein
MDKKIMKKIYKNKWNREWDKIRKRNVDDMILLFVMVSIVNLYNRKG